MIMRWGTGLRGCALLVMAAVALPALAFDLQGHRGARGLAPENTIAAFTRAVGIGVSTLETDIAVTRDGVLVLSHDPHLNADLVRGPDGRWLAGTGPAIHSLSFEDLRRYDIGRVNPESRYGRQWPEQKAADGERFPRLDELFTLARASGPALRLNLEIKITPQSDAETPDPERFAALVVEAVRAAGFANRVTIQSFDWRPLLVVRRIAPEIPIACLTIESANFNTIGAADPSPWHAQLRRADYGGSIPRLVQAAGCTTWSMFWRNLTPELLAESKALGLKVLPWTVNDPLEMRRLIGMGVDGLITDYPDRLRQVMSERGMPLP